jgi:putative membrane protein
MIESKLLEKFYSKLFTIPKKRISVTLGITTIFLASLLNGIVSKAFFAQRYFFLGLFIIACLLLAKRPLKLAFNSRRVFFLSLLILISIEVFDFIVIHLLDNFYLIVVAPASAATLLTMTFYFTSEVSERRVALVVAVIFLALYPVNHFYSFQVPHRALGYSLTTLFGVLLGIVFVKFIDKDFGIFNTKNLLKSFVLFWLTSKPEYFEREIEKVGIEQKGWIKCLSIGKAKLVSTAFHPGPMRNIGGALLVPEVLERVENSIYLHSTVKHENNLVSREEVEKVLSSIKCSCDNLKVFLPFEVEGQKYTLRVFPFEKVSLLILSGKDAIDDMPALLNEVAEEYFGEVMLVEAHNAYREDFEVTAEEFYELEELLRKASSTSTTESQLQCSFFKEKVEGSNICGYLALLLLKYSSGLYGILMLDGNNVRKSFRDELEWFGRKKKINLTVISTDNHSRTAVSPKVGYKPIGDDRDKKVVYAFLEKVLRNIEFEDARVSYSRNDVTAKVMGKKFFERVEEAFIALGEKALYLLVAVVLLQLVVTIVLGIAIL